MGKQCLDIDECDSEGRSSDCQFSCINTPGSYKCVTNDYYSAVAADQPIIEQVLTCPPGHERNDTTGSCEGTLMMNNNYLIDKVSVSSCLSIRNLLSLFFLCFLQTSTNANWTTEDALMFARTPWGAFIVLVEGDSSSQRTNSPAWVSENQFIGTHTHRQQSCL